MARADMALTRAMNNTNSRSPMRPGATGAVIVTAGPCAAPAHSRRRVCPERGPHPRIG